MPEATGAGGQDRGAPGQERRRYERRATPVTPPYFETFERIAVALERAVALLEQRHIRLPDVPARSAVPPRAPSDG